MKSQFEITKKFLCYKILLFHPSVFYKNLRNNQGILKMKARENTHGQNYLKTFVNLRTDAKAWIVFLRLENVHGF